MKRILTFFFVMLAATLVAHHSQAQSPYGPAAYPAQGYGGAPAYGPSMGYAPQAPSQGPNPYGVPPHEMPGYVPQGQGYAPQAYAPQGYAPGGYAPQAMPQAGPIMGYQGQGGPMPAAYSMQQPPAPPQAMPYGNPTPAAPYGESMQGGPGYGAPTYSEPGYGTPMYSDPGMGSQYYLDGGACSSCGANCGACDCGAYGLGGCGHHWGYNPLRQVYGGLELLSWYRNGTNVPVLVTTSPQGTTQANAGVLGVPTTRSLLGDQRLEDDLGGVRFTVGTWFDMNKEYGLVYRLSAVGGDDFGFNISSNDDGVPTIARPFFDTDLGDENALLIAFNDPVNGVYATGNINVGIEHNVTNNDLYATFMIAKGCGWRTDFLFGYQNTSIDETLRIQSFSTVQNALFAPGFAVGSTIDVLDVLAVENEFHGGLFGFQSELQHGPWSFRFLGKIGVGGTTSTASVSGRTITTSPTDPPTVATSDGGLFAQPTNMGTFEAESTTIAPEATLTLGYSCTQNLRLTAGYSFLYWTHIVPSNALIDRQINPTQTGGGALVGDPRPLPVISGDTDFWLMGLNLGAEYRY